MNGEDGPSAEQIGKGVVLDNGEYKKANPFEGISPKVEEPLKILKPKSERNLVMAGGADSDPNPFKNYFQLETDPDGNILVETETVTISTETYGPQKVEVPKDPREKWSYVNKALMLMERSKDADGGPLAQRAISRAGALINALMEDSYTRSHVEDAVLPDGKLNPCHEIGRKLSDEFTARRALHQIFIGYETADGIERITGQVSSLNAVHLNPLFHNLDGIHDKSEVGRALAYYDSHASEFFEKTGHDEDTFREEVMKEVAKTVDPNDTDYRKYAWAQTVAERLWTITGRMVAQDTEMKANVSGGNYFVRRLFNLEKWMEKNEEKIAFFPELIYPKDPNRKDRRVDLDEGDYFSKRIAGALYDYQKRVAKVDPKITDPKEIEMAKKIVAAEEVEKIIGVKGVEGKDGDYTWKLKTKDLDLSKILWDKIDFQVYGASPMLDWANYQLGNPDKARDAMLGKSDSFLRNPTPESLFALKDTFTYLVEGQWKAKAQLTENLAEFLRHDNWKKLKRSNLTVDGVKVLVKSAAVQKFILPKDEQEVIKEALKAESFFSLLRTQPTIRGIYRFIIHFFEGMLKDIFKQVSKAS